MRFLSVERPEHSIELARAGCTSSGIKDTRAHLEYLLSLGSNRVPETRHVKLCRFIGECMCLLQHRVCFIACTLDFRNNLDAGFGAGELRLMCLIVFAEVGVGLGQPGSEDTQTRNHAF